MKQLLLFTVLAFVLASCSQVAPEKKGCKPKKFSEDKVEAKCKGAEGTKAHVERHRKGHRAGFGKFKKHHKDLICQLKKIRDIAVKENATQTVKAIDELVDKTQKRFHEKAKLLKKKVHKREGWKKPQSQKAVLPIVLGRAVLQRQNRELARKLKLRKPALISKEGQRTTIRLCL